MCQAELLEAASLGPCVRHWNLPLSLNSAMGESVSTILSFPVNYLFFRAFIILCLNRNHPSNCNLQGILSKKKERLSPGRVGI